MTLAESILEPATETAKKIRRVLKTAYPCIKFSVTSSTFSMGSSVYVTWSDGPLECDVDLILNHFRSGSFDGMQDMYNTTGYLWEGKIIIGAKYIEGSRELLKERKKIIETWLVDKCENDLHGGYSVRAWIKAERELIHAGSLQGYTSQLPIESPLRDVPVQQLVEDIKEQACKVILFPVQNPEEQARKKAAQLMDALTPEQKLKIECLRMLMVQEVQLERLVENPSSIDQLFRIAAEKLFC